MPVPLVGRAVGASRGQRKHGYWVATSRECQLIVKEGNGDRRPGGPMQRRAGRQDHRPLEANRNTLCNVNEMGTAL
ncbi:hypothetical protein VTH06DRAFT_3483 [Thermothelomyces fergusii]